MIPGFHQGAMLGFDVESTGVNPEEDRIVQIGFAYVANPADTAVDRKLVHPGVPIPSGATEIHHITDDRVAGHPREAHLQWARDEIEQALIAGIPVVAFNAVFDLTMLDRELRRCGLEPLPALSVILDPLCMINAVTAWKRGHNLGRACEVYQIPLDHAHDAGDDALATTRLLWRLAETIKVLIRPEHRGIHTVQEHGRGAKPGDEEILPKVMPLGQVPFPWLMRAQADWYRRSVDGFVENQRSKGREPEGVNYQWPIIRANEQAALV